VQLIAVINIVAAAVVIRRTTIDEITVIMGDSRVIDNYCKIFAMVHC